MKTLKTVRKSGAVIAPRFWVWDGDTLYGPSFWRKPWPHDKPMHQPVEQIGRHGVYGFADVDFLYRWLAKNQDHEPVIVGTVRLWGTIFKSPAGMTPSGWSCGGFRAEYGRVHSLDYKVVDGNHCGTVAQIRISDDIDLRCLRQRYGVWKQ